MSDEPQKCQKCQYHLPWHLYTCPEISIDQLRCAVEQLEGANRHYIQIYRDAQNRADRWEGKYLRVKHENNQLRKKLFPQKEKPESTVDALYREYMEVVDQCRREARSEYANQPKFK